MQLTKHNTNDDVDARNSDDRVVHMQWECTHLCSQLVIIHSWLKFWALSHSIHGHPHGALSLSRVSFFRFFLFLLFVTVFFFHFELFLNSTARRSWQTCGAALQKGVRTPWSFSSLPHELNDSSVPFSFMIPSTDQDVDDMTLGEMFTAAHRGQVDYCVPGGMSVSQSSSVMFDGWRQPDGERMVDEAGKSDVTFNVISVHRKFSEDIQIERMVDRSGKRDERSSSDAKIRTLHGKPKKTENYHLISKNSHHELQAARAEEERRFPQGQLWRQKLEFCEVHHQSFTEMEESRKFQSF